MKTRSTLCRRGQKTKAVIREEVSHFRRQKRLNRLKVREMLLEGNWGWRRFIWQIYEDPVPPASGFFP